MKISTDTVDIPEKNQQVAFTRSYSYTLYNYDKPDYKTVEPGTVGKVIDVEIKSKSSRGYGENYNLILYVALKAKNEYDTSELVVIPIQYSQHYGLLEPIEVTPAMKVLFGQNSEK